MSKVKLWISIGFAVLACLCLSALALAGDPPVEEVPCTQMACPDAFGIGFSPARSWPAGDYTFTITYGDQKDICQATLPFDDPFGMASCTGAAWLMKEATYTVTGCDGEVCWAEQVPLEPKYHGFSGLSVFGFYASAFLRIERDGQVLLERDLTMGYQPVYPNGPECGIGCYQSNQILEVPIPIACP